MHNKTNLDAQRCVIMICILLLGLVNLSCKGDIGDECITSAQCQAGQVCDLISAGGYCTVTPCEPDTCPQGSVCVTFENDDRFCMATCGGSDDCRDDYRCDTELGPEPFCRQSGSN